MGERDFRTRLACLTTAIVVTLGVAACGSDSDGSDEASTAAGKATTSAEHWKPAEGGTPAEQEVQAAYAKVMNAIANGDAASACAGMTRETRVKFGPKPGQSCVKLLGKVNRAEFKGQEGRMVGARINGAKAIVFWDNRPDRPPNEIPFVRVNGEWKLDGAAF
jgi:hypothetical protein